MIESLAEHGVQPMDLVPALMTTHTVANPEYDPEVARQRAAEPQHHPGSSASDDDNESISDRTLVDQAISPPTTPTKAKSTTPSTLSPPLPNADQSPNSDLSHGSSSTPSGAPATHRTTARVLEDTSTSSMPGVTTSLSAADENVTLDIRWTVLCDLFLVLIADSVYDARSRVLLENVALKLGLGWLDVVKFESRVTEALEIQEDVETMENQDVLAGQQKAMKKRRYMMLGLATLGTSTAKNVLESVLNSVHRGWSRHRSIRWFAGACYRCRSWCGLYDYWHQRDHRVSRRRGWHGCDHNGRCPDWVWHSRTWNGEANPTCPNIRYSTITQQQASQLYTHRSRVSEIPS